MTKKSELKWTTEFTAVVVKTGELTTFIGPAIPAATLKKAQAWCNKNAGHLKVVGLAGMDGGNNLKQAII